MKELVLGFMFLCFSLHTVAQNNNRISGVVYDYSTKESVIQAGIQVLSPKDSSLISGTATDLNGKFSVSVKPGKYILGVSYIGYKKIFKQVDVSKTSVTLDTIYLKDDGILLSEAVVVAKAPEISVKGDTIEYNADSYKVQESAVVEDILKKMPGAEVDSEGKITINGKEVKKILVDGKEFFSDDPKVASKNLPAAMIDKLQVLDKKSDMAQMTGFDDGEDETVINLTIKKGMKQGIYGSATAGYGNKDRYGVSGIVNYMHDNNQFTLMGGSNNTNNEGFTDNAGGSFRGMRPRGMNFGGQNGILKSTNGGFNFAANPSDKLKWGGNVRVGTASNDVEEKKHTERYDTGNSKGNQYENKKNWGNNKSDNYGVDLRFEWTPDSLTKVIFTPRFQYGKNRNSQLTDYLTTYENPLDSINWGNSKYFSDGESNSGSANLDVSRQLGKKGRVLSFRLSGGFNNMDNDISNWSQTTVREEGKNDSLQLIDQLANQKNKGYNWEGYLSYVEPIGRNNFLQFNYRYKKNYSESDKNTFKNDGSGEYSVVDTTATRRLENNFINQEIGLNFKSVREKYNYTIGFALQPSRSNSLTTTPSKESRVTNDVLNFSPVAQFNYLWTKRHNLRIDYSGITTQPTTTQLSDVRDESDPLNITYGNPNLKPSFKNNLRVRYHNFNPEKASAFMMFGGFSFSTNDIVSKTMLKDGGKQETTYANVNGNWSANLRTMFNKPLRNKKFSVNSMSYGSFARDNGFINNSKNTVNTLTLMESAGLQFRSDLIDFGLRGNFKYTNTDNSLPTQADKNIFNFGGSFTSTLYLPYDFVIDTDLSYTGISGATQGYDQNEWLWNASVSKQIFKAKNGTLKFQIYDILQQKSNVSQTSSATAFTETVSNSLGSYFMVSFAYRFQIFKGGAKMSDMNGGSDHPMMRSGGRPPRM